MRILTVRPNGAQQFGYLSQTASIQESDLPALRGRFARLRKGATLKNAAPLIKIGFVNQTSRYYVFSQDLGASFVIGVSWNVPKGTDPVQFYPTDLLVANYELLSPAEEARIVTQDPVPEFAVKKTSLQAFYEASSKAFEFAERALSLAETGKFEDAQLVLMTPKMAVSPNTTGAFAERDKALLEFNVLQDIGIFTVEEASAIRRSVLVPLLDTLNKVAVAIQERQGYFAQLLQSAKKYFTGAVAKMASVTDEKWKNFLAFYRALVEFDQTATKDIAELRASALTPAGRQETNRLEENLIRIRAVRARIEATVKAQGINPADLSKQAGLGDGGTTGLIIAAVVFTIVGIIISTILEPLIHMLIDLWRGREGKIKAYEEELRLQQQAQENVAKEQAEARKKQLEFEVGKFDGLQAKGRHISNTLSNLTGEKITLEKLEEIRRQTAGGSKLPASGLEGWQWAILAAGGGILAAYLVSTYVVGKKEA